MNLVIALIVGIITALIVVGSMVSQLKNVHSKQGAADYEKQGSFKLEESKDIYLYEKVEKQAIPKN